MAFIQKILDEQFNISGLKTLELDAIIEKGFLSVYDVLDPNSWVSQEDPNQGDTWVNLVRGGADVSMPDSGINDLTYANNSFDEFDLSSTQRLILPDPHKLETNLMELKDESQLENYN